MKSRILIATLALLATVADARIVKLVVESTESPAFKGQAFGAAGQYETLRGHFYGELDPRDPHNVIITDLALAPRNARGMVEYSGTFAISRPVDMSKSSGVLMYHVVNRGRGDVAGSADGHISVVSGWQGDLLGEGLQTITVPAAHLANGASITGPVIERLINSPAGATTLALNSAPYVALTYQRPATLDMSAASLMRRPSQPAPQVAVPSSEWAFADCSTTPFPGTPDATKICVKGGFDPASEYVVRYTAKDPLVLGIGFAATRDLNSFLRFAAKDDPGTPNPLAGEIKWVISEGASQSGNFIRTFIHLGFNQDESGKTVWDGANPHVAARLLAMNLRFAVASGAAGVNEPGSEGVLWWGTYEDRARHRPAASLLDRCMVTKTCPKIFDTFGALEMWYLRESPDLVGTDAKRDIPLPPNVRRYFFPGTSHGGGPGGFSAATPAPPRGCTLPANPNPESDTMRALNAALVDWVTKGTAPPPSRYPTLAEGQLAPATRAGTGMPAIPGLPNVDGLVNLVYDYDYGPEFKGADLSGVISIEPPAIRGTLPTLVPKVDADGNDLGGVPSVLRQVPLGTYLGWNVTASGFDQGRICTLSGGYIPFAKTKAERVAAGDPRPSLEERYKTYEAYVAAVRAAAEKAVRERFLLPRDADRLIAAASASDVLK